MTTRHKYHAEKQQLLGRLPSPTRSRKNKNESLKRTVSEESITRKRILTERQRAESLDKQETHENLEQLSESLKLLKLNKSPEVSNTLVDSQEELIKLASGKATVWSEDGQAQLDLVRNPTVSGSIVSKGVELTKSVDGAVGGVSEDAIQKEVETADSDEIFVDENTEDLGAGDVDSDNLEDQKKQEADQKNRQKQEVIV